MFYLIVPGNGFIKILKGGQRRADYRAAIFNKHGLKVLLACFIFAWYIYGLNNMALDALFNNPFCHCLWGGGV